MNIRKWFFENLLMVRFIDGEQPGGASPIETPIEGAGTPQGAVASEADTAGGQQTAGTPKPADAYDPEWWKKDPERFGKTWKTPDDVIKSAWHSDQLIEKQYKPLRAQVDAFTKVFQEYGHEASLEKLKAIFDDHKKWNDPENNIVKRGNFLSFFLDHPEYKVETENFLESMRKREVQKQFPGMSDEMINKIVSLEQFKADQEAKEKAANQKREQEQYLSQITKGWEDVQKECRELGFPVTDEIRTKLLKECFEQGINPQHILYKFMDMYKDEVNKYRNLKIQSEYAKTQQRRRKTGIIPASPTPTRTAPAKLSNGIIDHAANIAKKLGIT